MYRKEHEKGRPCAEPHLVMVAIVGLTVPAAADDVRQAIEQVNSQVMAAFKAGDAAAIASHYSETAKMLPPDATEIAGREAIQESVAGLA